MAKSRGRLILSGLLFLCGLPAVFGQQAEPPGITIRTSTRVVLVDAIVTDNKSQPVSDLKASDFTVLEDGKPQKVAFFSYESLAAQQQKAATPLPPLRPGIFTNHPAYNPPKGPMVILLMDGLNTPPNQSLYVRQQILKYLTNLKTPASGTAVLALGNSLNVVQNFTTNQELLLAAAQTYRTSRTAVDIQAPGAALIDATKGIGAPAGGAGYISNDPISNIAPNSSDSGSLAGAQALRARFEKEVSAAEQDVRTRITLAALRNISRAVAGYPGRKALLWFSAGFPFSLDLNGREDFSIYKSYRDELRQASAMLSDANIAIYPIDARTLFANSLSDVSAQSAGVGVNSEAPKTDLSGEVFKKFNVEASMDTLARDTGGMVFRNTNDLSGAMQTAIKDSQSYYVLGYYAERKNWDGKFHSIKVVPANKDLNVRARNGYYALNPADWKKGAGGEEKQMTTSELSGLAATGVLFYSQVVPPAKPGDNVVVELLVDTDTITFGSGAITQGEGSSNASRGLGGQSADNTQGGSESVHQTDLQFEVGAFFPDGKLAHVETRGAQANLREETYQQLIKAGKLGMKIEFPLKPGQYLLRVAVRDNRTGQAGTLDIPLKVNE